MALFHYNTHYSKLECYKQINSYKDTDETIESYCNGFVNKDFYVFAKVEWKDLFQQGFRVTQCSKLNDTKGPDLRL